MMMKMFCFLGVKRCNDIQKVKRNNVVYREDNRVKVWMEQD